MSDEILDYLEYQADCFDIPREDARDDYVNEEVNAMA